MKIQEDQLWQQQNLGICFVNETHIVRIQTFTVFRKILQNIKN